MGWPFSPFLVWLNLCNMFLVSCFIQVRVVCSAVWREACCVVCCVERGSLPRLLCGERLTTWFAVWRGSLPGLLCGERLTVWSVVWRGSLPGLLCEERLTHLLSATVRVYSLVAPCRLPDLTSLALLGSVSGQRGLSRGPLPGYKTVSKWRLQLQDSIPFLLLSQRLCTTLHTSASLGCYLLFTHMPDCPLAPLGQVWQQ